ncbi:hypothetical protein [Kineococcus sp. NPDC059986]|uniref:hypothetical protein n=1 Tax=Kineococcus sp. NPDC059986 TaxID=3155538 RepID=UPI00344CFC64
MENYLRERIQYWGGWEINDLLIAARTQPDIFVLLCGVDRYDVTVFNRLQCHRLDWELQEMSQRRENKALRTTATRIRQLCDLVRLDSPSGPVGHHVRFIGD